MWSLKDKHRAQELAEKKVKDKVKKDAQKSRSKRVKRGRRIKKINKK